MKKGFMVIAAAVVLIAGAAFIQTGFHKRTDVGLVGYSISEDGSTLTMQTGVFSSMGYIRDIKTVRDGDKLYCSFYNAFGGLNSKIGAKNVFTLQLDSGCKEIYFDRSQAEHELVLQKDGDTSQWAYAYETK